MDSMTDLDVWKTFLAGYGIEFTASRDFNCTRLRMLAPAPLLARSRSEGGGASVAAFFDEAGRFLKLEAWH